MVAIFELELERETLRKTINFLDQWREQSQREVLKKPKQSEREASVNPYFHLLAQWKWAAAKRTLEKIKKTFEPSQWSSGYINALEGMVAALEVKSDRNSFIKQMKIEKCDELRKQFLQQSQNFLHDDFDKGFFVAWVDYTRALKKIAKVK